MKLVLYDARVLPLNPPPSRDCVATRNERVNWVTEVNNFYSALNKGSRRAPLSDGHQHRLRHAFSERPLGLYQPANSSSKR